MAAQVALVAARVGMVVAVAGLPPQVRQGAKLAHLETEVMAPLLPFLVRPSPTLVAVAAQESTALLVLVVLEAAVLAAYVTHRPKAAQVLQTEAAAVAEAILLLQVAQAAPVS